MRSPFQQIVQAPSSALFGLPFRLGFEAIWDMKVGRIIGAEAFPRIEGVEGRPSDRESRQAFSRAGAAALGHLGRLLAAWREDGLRLDLLSLDVTSSMLHRDHVLEALRELAATSPATQVVAEVSTSNCRELVMAMVGHLHRLQIAVALEGVREVSGAPAELAPQLVSQPGVRYVKLEVSQGREANSVSFARILKLCSHHGIRVVASGLTDSLQSELLRRLGCRYGQGKLLSDPLSADGFFRLAADLQGDPD